MKITESLQAGARKKNKEEDDEYESDFIDDDEEAGLPTYLSVGMLFLFNRY